MPYKSEAAFGHDLDDVMRKEGWDVHNIQTPTTERGCPDRFMQNRIGVWIELKNIHTSVKGYITVAYRPGQQAWLYRHHKHGGLGFTMIAGEDGYIIFRNQGILKDKVYSQGKWPQLYMSHLYGKTLSKWLLETR